MKSIFDTTFINATNYNWFYKLIGRKDEYITYGDFIRYCIHEKTFMTVQFKLLKQLNKTWYASITNCLSPRIFKYKNRNIFYFKYLYGEFNNE